jgi:hypothetical protein
MMSTNNVRQDPRVKQVIMTDETGKEATFDSIHQAANLLFYDPATLRGYIRDGKIHNGRTYRYKVAER